LTGNCGRLKCCLKYEYDVYSKIAEKIVPVGTLIYLDDKILKVKKLDIPNENAVVTNETDNTTTITNFNDLKSFLNSGTVVKPSNYCDSNKDEIVDLSEIEG